MEILIRLFVWILNRTYGRNRIGSSYWSNPMDEKVLLDLEAERELEREAQQQTAVVESFKSTAVPVQGAVDYRDIQWDSFSRAVETPEQFTFYSGRSIAKIISKEQFSSRQELLALRRVIRRQVAECELLD